MVFGGLIGAASAVGLLFSGLGSSFFGNLGALAKTAPHQPGQPDPTVVFGRMATLMKELAPYTNAITAGKLLLSIALIVIGYGLYTRVRWSRSGAIAWSVLALLFLAVELVLRIGIIQPRTNEVMKEILTTTPNAAAGAAMMQAIGSRQSVITVIVNVILFAPFPIVLLALCGRRSAAADFVD
jgi:hypothetical protein